MNEGTDAIIRAVNCRVTAFLPPLLKEVGSSIYHHSVPVGQDTRCMGLKVQLSETNLGLSSSPWPEIVDCC